MKKYIFFLMGAVCFLLSSSAVHANELNKSDANIIGHVLDKNTEEHLSFISVSLKGTTIGTMTDASGHYFLKNLPEGEFTMEVSAVGYKTVSRKVTLRKGKTLEENFEIEEDLIALDGVVVSANRSETTRRMAPTLVNVMDVKVFENTNSSTLSQGLNFQPGVRVENNCQNCGFQQVRINGLDGPYTQILIDSRPIFSALAGVYGLEQIPANMIERVEVMRGGGSALFGSSAIAGTINIITKEPVRNSGQLTHTLTGIGGTSSWDNNTTLNASLVTDNHKAGLYIFGQNRERSGYDNDGDGYTELPKLKNQTVGFRSFIKTSTYSKLTFEYHHLSEFRRGGNKLNRPPHEADIAEQLQHTINSGGAKFDYFSPDEKQRLSVYASAQHTGRDSYYGGGQDVNAYGATTDFTWVTGSQYIYSFDKCFFMPADFTGGLEYNQDNLTDDMWGYNRYTKQEVRIASAFFQNEWKNKQWSFLLGGRLDKHNLMNHATRAPLIVRVPHCRGGKAKGIVEFVDIYPTLCELCGVPMPKDQLQGKSFVPILQDSGKKTKQYAFIQWKGGYNIVSEQYSSTIWLQGDSVVARMIFDRQLDASENENKVHCPYLSRERDKLEAQIKIRKSQL